MTEPDLEIRSKAIASLRPGHSFSSVRRKLIDRVAAWIITAGGLFVILSIIGMLLLFVTEIAPLWQAAEVKLIRKIPVSQIAGSTADNALAVGCEEYQRIGYVVTAGGFVRYFDLQTGTPLNALRAPLPENERVRSTWLSLEGTLFALGTDSGKVVPGSIDIRTHFEGSVRKFEPAATFREPIRLDPQAAAVTALAVAGDPEESLFIAGLSEDGRLLLYGRQVESSLFGEGEVSEFIPRLDSLPARPSALALDDALTALFIGCEDGQLLKYSLEDPENPVLVERHQAGDSPIRRLDFLIGGRSLVVGEASGRISVWFEAFDANNEGPRLLKRAHAMAGHTAAITALGPSQRNRTFITGSRNGDILMQFSTNARTLYRDHLLQGPVAFIRMAPKGNGALVLGSDAAIYHLDIDNPHPEANWQAFFQKTWYEGYPKPEYVWQSSSGSDDFEAKLSLVPLIFGTLKGTFYALLFALPIAVLAAVYVSQFMHANWRSVVKPSMEIMAALPSVIIGFIGGLWLAPRVQPVIPGILLTLILVPLSVLALSWLAHRSSNRCLQWLSQGSELFILIPLVLFIGWASLSLNGLLEANLFGGDFSQWLYQSLNLPYDQRNAFVVGLVMGFAVIPIIFTISEDALANVPSSLTAASLALGATRWQTAFSVVLPTASPGIFSATMIGLGRAVGETMIVLMATGNTPIMDWNIFNGFRTLSANIAVEIPEAPEGGTLFRTLFLSALLLFLITFVVNTLAEVVRQRMRKKFETH